ncbi:MAG: DMT family transporter [Planctomycetota bacterium]
MTGETLGYTAAVTAAMLWAAATILYGKAGTAISPVRLNAIKGVAVTLLFGVVLAITQPTAFKTLADEPMRVLLLLAISGVIGITAGDSCYFASVNRIGPRRVALLFLTSTPMTVLGGVAFLGERLGPWQLVGIALTITGVTWVVLERTTEKPKDSQVAATLRVAEDRAGAFDRLRPAGSQLPDFVGDTSFRAGLLLGLLAALGQAIGALINRQALLDSDLPPLTTAFFRLGISAIALIPLAIIMGNGKRTGGVPGRVWLYVAAAALMGTFGGIWLQQAAFDNAPAGPTQTLLSTTPIWILPLAAATGDRVTLRAVIGAVVAMTGVVLLLLR